MHTNSYYKFFLFFLVLLSISSFFTGFIYGENSSGAGTFEGDFKHVWINLQTFLNNNISDAFDLTFDSDNYQSSRTPLIYILHKLFNPLTENKNHFLNSVFIISLSVPILFYYCLKQKFNKENNLLLILISSTVLLSPYFRTSAYWGLEENYGIISFLISFLFFYKFLKNNKNTPLIYFQLFFTVFFSSLCVYFDQKLIIVPLICFVSIYLSDKQSRLKFFSIILYFIFSMPYIYLIYSWGNLIPVGDAELRGIGAKFHFSHIGYLSTIIAFYFFPLFFFKEKSFIYLSKNFFKKKRSYYLIFLFFVYLFYLIIFYDLGEDTLVGKGYIHKLTIIIFDNIIFQQIFIYFSFFISWLLILIFLNENLNDKLIILYFFLLSILVWPIFQEYFDPLIILIAFTFFNSKLIINYKNAIVLFLYFAIFLIFSNIYYYNLLN